MGVVNQERAQNFNWNAKVGYFSRCSDEPTALYLFREELVEKLRCFTQPYEAKPDSTSYQTTATSKTSPVTSYVYNSAKNWCDAK
jgi:hypothetical protein